MTQRRGDSGARSPAPPPPRPFEVALRRLCPRCGAPGLFSGVAAFADRCAACGLDFRSFNVGDGPAAFLTLILGAIVVGLAVAVQLSFDPPLWLQMLLWVPVTAGLVLVSLRLSKALLLALEYRNAAGEGRERRPDAEGPRP